MSDVFGTRDYDPGSDSGVFTAMNAWSGGTVHALATYNKRVPLCCEAEGRRSSEPLPGPDEDTWYIAIPEGHAVSNYYPTTCKECLEWLGA